MSTAAIALSPRLQREWLTIQAMLRLHCRRRHTGQGGAALCTECEQLAVFSRRRLQRCPFGEGKGTCRNCTVHCWQGMQDHRAQIRSIMREEGPRMMWHHPLMSLRHWLDGWRRFSPHLGKAAQRDKTQLPVAP